MLAAALVSVALFAVAPMQEPTVGTGAATDITSTSVTVSGEVDGFGELTRYWFQFGTSTEYGGGTEPFTTADASTVAVTATLTGLEPNTTYHYRIVAQNQDGELHGADATFTTAPSGCTTLAAPQASTAAATSVSATRATLNGTVSAPCGSAQYSFVYGTTTAYGQTTAAVSGSGTVSAVVSGLHPGTTYHFGLVATNGAGTSDGADRAFTTSGVEPIKFVRAPRNVRERARFTMTVGLRTAAVLTIEIVHGGRISERLRLGRRTGIVRARARAPRAAGGYEIRVLAAGGGTMQIDRLKLSVRGP